MQGGGVGGGGCDGQAQSPPRGTFPGTSGAPPRRFSGNAVVVDETPRGQRCVRPAAGPAGVPEAPRGPCDSRVSRSGWMSTVGKRRLDLRTGARSRPTRDLSTCPATSWRHTGDQVMNLGSVGSATVTSLGAGRRRGAGAPGRHSPRTSRRARSWARTCRQVARTAGTPGSLRCWPSPDDRTEAEHPQTPRPEHP